MRASLEWWSYEPRQDSLPAFLMRLSQGYWCGGTLPFTPDSSSTKVQLFAGPHPYDVVIQLQPEMQRMFAADPVSSTWIWKGCGEG
jgi:hypothetical protein